jgi:hypothetical protein
MKKLVTMGRGAYEKVVYAGVRSFHLGDHGDRIYTGGNRRSRQVGVVLDQLNANGMEDVNTLYLTILNQTYRRESGPWRYQ